MILDESLEFCDATALNTGAAGTYNIGDIIDIGTARNIGGNRALYLVVTCAVGIKVASGAGKLAFQLVSDGTDTISTSTQSVHARSGDWATSTTEIPVGTVLFAMQLPIEGVPYERYLALQQITTTTAISAGAVNAFLTMDVAKWVAYDSHSQG